VQWKRYCFVPFVHDAPLVLLSPPLRAEWEGWVEVSIGASFTLAPFHCVTRSTSSLYSLESYQAQSPVAEITSLQLRQLMNLPWEPCLQIVNSSSFIKDAKSKVVT